MSLSGWIVLQRSLLDWEWYNDANTMRLFMHCILKANFEPKKWQGVTIERGQFITSYPNLAAELGLSVKQIRGSLDKLKKTGEVAVKTSNKFSLISITNFKKYQDKGSQEDSQKLGQEGSQGAVRGHSKGNNVTTKQYNNKTNNKPPCSESPDGEAKPSAGDKPSKFNFSADQLELASRMAGSVRERFPSQKINLDEWADAVRKLEELDGLSRTDLINLWQWILKHDAPGFSWADQIRTPMKLRQRDSQKAKYYEMLSQKMARESLQTAKLAEVPKYSNVTKNNLVTLEEWASGKS